MCESCRSIYLSVSVVCRFLGKKVVATFFSNVACRQNPLDDLINYSSHSPGMTVKSLPVDRLLLCLYLFFRSIIIDMLFSRNVQLVFMLLKMAFIENKPEMSQINN